MAEQAPFSVIMCTYNGMDGKRAGELNQSLLSILHQSLPPTEVIMVVDGPIDAEQERVLKSFQDTNLPFDFKIIRQEKNQGAAVARDVAAKAATQPWLAIMDSDDISTKDRFEKQAAFLAENPDADLLCGAAFSFEDRPEKITSYMPALSISPSKEGLPNTHPSVVIKKETLQKVGGYSERGLRLSEDLNLWVRLKGQNAKIMAQEEPVCFFRRDDKLLERRREAGQIKGHWVTAGDMHKYGMIDSTERVLLPLRALAFYHVTSRLLSLYNSLPEPIKETYRNLRYSPEQVESYEERKRVTEHFSQSAKDFLAPEVIENQLPTPRSDVVENYRHGNIETQRNAMLLDFEPEGLAH